MGISGVRERDVMGNEANEYSEADVGQLRGHEKDSTDNVMNDIRRGAGYSGSVPLRADDETANEIREREEANSPTNVGRASGGGTLHLVAEGLGEGTAAEALSVVGGVALELYGFYHEINIADALGAATDRDHVRLATLSQLDLPAEFKQQEIDKLSGKHTDGLHGAAQKIAERIKLDPAAHAQFARVQLHADQGMHAALEMKAAKMDFATYMKAHPEAVQRYQQDDAFKRGFDAIGWASDPKRDPKVLADTVAALHARDARYDAQHVQWRA